MEIPDNWHTLAPIDERRAAMHELAAQGRVLADRLIASQASTEELLAATESLRSLLSLLPERGSVAPERGFLGVPPGGIDTFADQSPVIGLSNMTAPPALLHMSDGVVEGVVSFGVPYEGPPGHVHGGWISAVFDEVLGMVQATTKKPGMTGRLEVSYRRPTPLNTPIHFRGVVDRVEGRKIYTSARSFNPDTDETYGEATGLFISIEFDRFTSPTRPDGLGHTKYVQDALAQPTQENFS
jgi:acyl-coenzyme A thioesterase PaaI-like protein